MKTPRFKFRKYESWAECQEVNAEVFRKPEKDGLQLHQEWVKEMLRQHGPQKQAAAKPPSPRDLI